ncbi:NUDIX hydrolase [Actibacterium sp. XHP0104]|uniref:NUDIX hydrolase n=1 Tax=Actibacterium sp. XHP0104 TaxID=2984335 RepID=UPI0021E7D63C|nr:NUDIX hydrolase [Actibacterium sp. XHP0104]MCV2882932.1 NUDIX hydrolase [Actibacterium sp. XHP0104]
MQKAIKLTWGSVVQPMFQRPPALQVAALCYRLRKGQFEVLMITSRGTGRWIIPKGWPIEGLDSPGAALREAWEEAGVKIARSSNAPVGRYSYSKRLDNDVLLPCVVDVYAVRVEKIANEYPESKQRKRRWVSPKRAAKMVDEPDLQELLRQFTPPLHL